ncbi:GNAT family N-acetyltransferase [Haloechinothrix sp. LS1_15]|nr:GNAT family N-acetyltransferase [Haloechinothrix sp. LS1_15]
MVPRALDHPDARDLIAGAQQVYVDRYGQPDHTPIRPDEFTGSSGHFLIGYRDGLPVVCGGWRAVDDPPPELMPGDAEMKRVYVPEYARGRGYARLVVTAVERSALAHGRSRMVLETGIAQPEAIGLYTSMGYEPIPAFGEHRNEPASRCFAKPLPSSSIPRAVPCPAQG